MAQGGGFLSALAYTFVADKDEKRRIKRAYQKKHGHLPRSHSPSSKDKKKKKKTSSKKVKKRPEDYSRWVRFFGFKGTMKNHWTRRRAGVPGNHRYVKNSVAPSKYAGKYKSEWTDSPDDSNGASPKKHKKRSSHRSSSHTHRRSSRQKHHRSSRHTSDRSSHRVSSRSHTSHPTSQSQHEWYSSDYTTGDGNLTARPSQQFSDEPLRPDDSISGIMARLQEHGNI
jgi:hypothetical protein